MTRFAGVDGCPGGWLCIVRAPDTNSFTASVFRTAADLLTHDPKINVMTIDMPMGLVDTGRRRCDELARDMLRRSACVCVECSDPPGLVCAVQTGRLRYHAESYQSPSRKQ